MQDVYLFVKRNCYYSLGSSKIGENMYNLPQYNTDITLWKGIDNTIQFSIRDRDRKGYALEGNEIFLNIIHPKLNKKIVKKLDIVDEYKGLYNVVFTQSELKDFEPTFYQASVVAKNLENQEEILYSGTEWCPIFDINVKEGLRDVFQPSHIIDLKGLLYNYYSDDDGKRYNYHTSSKIKADESDSHTASIIVDDNFIGNIIMESSVMETPSENDWVIIDSKEYTKESQKETILFNKQLNCLWVRFKIETEQDELKILEIEYRN